MSKSKCDREHVTAVFRIKIDFEDGFFRGVSIEEIEFELGLVIGRMKRISNDFQPLHGK